MKRRNFFQMIAGLIGGGLFAKKALPSLVIAHEKMRLATNEGINESLECLLDRYMEVVQLNLKQGNPLWSELRRRSGSGIKGIDRNSPFMVKMKDIISDG